MKINDQKAFAFVSSLPSNFALNNVNYFTSCAASSQLKVLSNWLKQFAYSVFILASKQASAATRVVASKLLKSCCPEC